MIFKADSSAYTPPVIPEIGDSKELFLLFARELPAYMKEIAVSLLPIILFFMIFQIFMLKLTIRKLKKIAIGLVYTYAGLVLFLTGVNVGSCRREIISDRCLRSLPTRCFLFPSQ